MAEILVAITIIACLLTPAIAALIVHSDIELDSIKTKIKDFFYRKSEKGNPSPVYREENDDLKTFEKELKNLDLEIEYAIKLKEMEKQKKDKELRLKRLYADEDEFETLYVVYDVDFFAKRTVQGVYQTQEETRELLDNARGARLNFAVEEFKYLPNKEEE